MTVKAIPLERSALSTHEIHDEVQRHARILVKKIQGELDHWGRFFVPLDGVSIKEETLDILEATFLKGGYEVRRHRELNSMEFRVRPELNVGVRNNHSEVKK